MLIRFRSVCLTGDLSRPIICKTLQMANSQGTRSRLACLAISIGLLSAAGCRSADTPKNKTVKPNQQQKTTRPNAVSSKAPESSGTRLTTIVDSLRRRDSNGTPQLGQIYSKFAQHHDGHRNPVIVIPGILGSRLVDRRSKKVVWGEFGVGTTVFDHRRSAGRLAMPMRPGQPLRDLTDTIEARSVLDRLDVRLFGFPIHVQAYAGILKTLGIGGYRDSTLGLSSVDYGDQHFSCFQFFYDWRRSNVENAQRLDEFVRITAKYVKHERKKRFGIIDDPVRFDIVAHSMGGLMARYYLRFGARPLPADGSLPKVSWAGAKHVERLILVGTPNGGSVETLKELVEGMRISTLLPKYDAAIVGTMPAAYELLPRPRHLRVVELETNRAIDVYDPSVWTRYRWGLVDPKQDRILRSLLPNAKTFEERRAIALDHLTKSLRQARRFHAALDQSAAVPAGTSIHLFAGDAIPTVSVVSVDARTGILKTVEKHPGDGVVTRASALLDERLRSNVKSTSRLVSPIAWTSVMFLFNDHLGLTSDPAFTDNALHLLLEAPRRHQPR